MTGASNTINDAAPGLNLKLTGTNAGAPTTIRFSEPTAAVTTFSAPGPIEVVTAIARRRLCALA